MSWSTWWLFLATETVLSLSPGPAVLLVVSQSLRFGPARALWSALGIVSANVVWFALSALGIGTALLAAGDWFLALKWIGAAYLVYLGLKSIVFGSRIAAMPDGDLPQATRLGSLGRGFLLQITNPKALVFFVALLPQFVDPRFDVGRQILILGVTSVLAEFPVLALYSAVAGGAYKMAREKRIGRAIDYLAGALLITAGVGMALGGQTTAPPNGPAGTFDGEGAPLTSSTAKTL